MNSLTQKQLIFMVENLLVIPDLGKKLSLLLDIGLNGIHKACDLSKQTGIDASEISRYRRRGDDRISRFKFKSLCKVYADAVEEKLWFESIDIFTNALTANVIETTPQGETVATSEEKSCFRGIDFESRIKDKKILEKTFDIMKGYWESYRYAVSNPNGRYIVYGLLEIKKLNENCYFECSYHEGDFYYHGYGFQGMGGLFFMLEEGNLINGTIFMVTNLPNSYPKPEINGIGLGLTGGSFSILSIPAAARVVFRRPEAIELLKKKNDDSSSLKELVKEVQVAINSDLSPWVNSSSESENILNAIDNHVPQDAVPYALRAKLF